MKITLVKDGREAIHRMPKHWNDLSLKKYIRVMKVLRDKNITTDLEKVAKMIRILTDINEEDILRLPAHNVHVLGGYLARFLATEPNDELNHVLKFNGVKYGFHPKLSDISFGEWVDIDNYIKEGVEDNLHKIMAVLYRPIKEITGDKYQIEEYTPSKERDQVMLDNLKVGDFHGVSVFFSSLGLELSTASVKSSIQELKQERKRRQEEGT